VGDMSPALQTKILRVLQEQEFERIGGLKTIKVNVRVIAATHRDLENEIKKGKFREDLFYRLNVIPIDLPPLRERKTDIPILIDHFLKRFNEEKRQNVAGFSEEALKVLINYHWPGNVRELENMNERLVILKGKGSIEVQDLPEKVKKFSPQDIFRNITLPDTGIDFNTAISQFERELILQALTRTNWVKNKAAKLLHMNRTTLVEKMKKKNIMKEAS
jgi:DNA-binding NtrC family response regulator